MTESTPEMLKSKVVLESLLAVFDIADFYNIEFTKYEIKLQGELNSKFLKKAATILMEYPVDNPYQVTVLEDWTLSTIFGTVSKSINVRVELFDIRVRITLC